MIATIDREKAMELLEQAVQLKGESYKDPASIDSSLECVYFDANDRPLCIVGHVLADLVPDKSFQNDEIQNVVQEIWSQEANDVEFPAPSEDYYNGGYIDLNKDVTLTAGAVTVLRAAQAVQDSGSSWGTALDKAREVSAQFERDGFGV